MKREVYYVSTDMGNKRHEHTVILYHGNHVTDEELEKACFNAAMTDAFARNEWLEWTWSSPAPCWADEYDKVENVNESQHYSV